MKSLYFILSKSFFLLPIMSVIFNYFLSNNEKTQKKVNNILYLFFVLALCVLYVFCISFGEYNFSFLQFSFGNLLSFSFNTFNLSFAIVTFTCFLFFLYNFQNSFEFLKLFKKAILYQEQFLFIFLFFFFGIFSNNILSSFFYYILMIISCLFLLKNPELKDLRKRYSITFLFGLISCVLLIILFSNYYFNYNYNLEFKIQSLKNASFYSVYYVITSLFLLIIGVFTYPIYYFIKEKLYYEDFLPTFTIYFLPFVFFGTFLFIKIAYFLFYNDFNNLSLYFYYAQYILTVLFIVSVVFLITNIKNSLKFTILFNVSNFLIFLSQILFAVSPIEFKNFLLKFTIYISLVFSGILAYSGILYYLLNSGTNSIQILYKKSRIQINFYLFLLVGLMIFNLFNYSKLNFFNFNLFYFINLLEIISLFFVFFAFIYFLLMKKIEFKKNMELKDVSKEQLSSFFMPSIIVFILFLILFFYNNI